MFRSPPLSFINQCRDLPGFQCTVEYTGKKSQNKRSVEKEKCPHNGGISCILSLNCCTQSDHRKQQFFVLRSGTSDDEQCWVDVMVVVPRQYNYGYGPTTPSRFFRLYADTKQVGVWYCDQHVDWRSYAYLLSYGALDERRMLSVCEYRDLPAFELPSKDETFECRVCMEEDRQALVYAFCCNTTICCEECAARFGKCPLCHTHLQRYVDIESLDEVVAIAPSTLIEPMHTVVPQFFAPANQEEKKQKNNKKRHASSLSTEEENKDAQKRAKNE